MKRNANEWIVVQKRYKPIRDRSFTPSFRNDDDDDDDAIDTPTMTSMIRIYIYILRSLRRLSSVRTLTFVTLNAQTQPTTNQRTNERRATTRWIRLNLNLDSRLNLVFMTLIKPACVIDRWFSRIVARRSIDRSIDRRQPRRRAISAVRFTPGYLLF